MQSGVGKKCISWTVQMLFSFCYHNKNTLGQWLCGSVGRAVASDDRGLRFDSSHRQNLLNLFLLSTVLKRRK